MGESSSATTVEVPFLDLRVSHAPLTRAILEGIADVIDRSAFVNGPEVSAFERAWADFCGAGACIGLASGLDALRLGLIACEIAPGDEVIVPANTFVATFEAVSQAGGSPVPVDVADDDYNIDPQAVEAALGSRTRCLLPVHLYGQLADMERLTALADREGLVLAEDACQAHGAHREGFRAGTAGAFGAFSFYPAKNLGAMGDAGALVTNDESLAAAVRSLREHGQRAKYQHAVVGYTGRLDTIQALVLLEKLKSLERWTDERRAIAASYSAQLAAIGDLRLPPVADGSRPVWHLYVVRTARRDGLADFLSSRGIGTGQHYPEPPHLSDAYAHLGYKPGAFPVAEAIARECLSLPIFPGMREAQQAAVVDAVRSFFVGG